MTHLTFEQCNELVDDALTAGERRLADEHLAVCAQCGEQVQRLTRLRATAQALPREMAPPDELWRDIRASIENTRVSPLRPWWARSPRLAAAATLVLMAASSAVTVLVLQRNDRGRVAPSSAAVLPATWVASEQGYLGTAEELTMQLEAQRDRLGPETIATVERALTTIDAAIDEARRALAGDPGNAALADLLASNYRQKVELLRRATQLGET